MNLVLFERERLELSRGGWLPHLLALYIVLGSFWLLVLGAWFTSFGSKGFGQELLLESYIAWVAGAIALVGALTVAQSYSLERSQGTFEALLQSGLSPFHIVISKALVGLERGARVLIGFLPTSFVLWLVGDIGVVAWALAHLGLIVTCGVFVALGSVFGARAAQPGSAVIGALLATVLASLASIGGSVWLGVRLWERFPVYPKYAPFWLPTALGNAPFSHAYLLLLCLFPAIVVSFALWFGLLVAQNGLKHPLDERTSGYRRFCLAATAAWLVLAVLTELTISLDSVGSWVAISLVTMVLFFGGALVLAGEPTVPTARHRHLAQGSSPPTLVRSLVLATAIAACVTSALGLLGVVRAGTPDLRITIGGATLHTLIWQSLWFVLAGWLVQVVGVRARRGLVVLSALAAGLPLLVAAGLTGFSAPTPGSTLASVPSPSSVVFLLTAPCTHGGEVLLRFGVSLGVPCLLTAILWLAFLRRAHAVPADTRPDSIGPDTDP